MSKLVLMTNSLLSCCAEKVITVLLNKLKDSMEKAMYCLLFPMGDIDS